MKILHPEDFAWLFGCPFQGLTISPSRDGRWNIILRSTRAGQAVYLMTVHDSPAEGLNWLWEMGSNRDVDKLWRLDKYRA